VRLENSTKGPKAHWAQATELPVSEKRLNIPNISDLTEMTMVSENPRHQSEANCPGTSAAPAECRGLVDDRYQCGE
jgi:hypothetical protein